MWKQDDDYKLSNVLMFVRPPMLLDDIQENGKYNTGMNAYGWFIWTKGHTSEEVSLKQIDNSDFVNRKRDGDHFKETPS